MDENRFAIGIWVNPLLFSSLDAYLSKGSEIDFSKLITNLSNPDTDSSVEALKKRYEQLTKHDQGLFLVPLDDVILKQIGLAFAGRKTSVLFRELSRLYCSLWYCSRNGCYLFV